MRHDWDKHRNELLLYFDNKEEMMEFVDLFHEFLEKKEDYSIGMEQ